MHLGEERCSKRLISEASRGIGQGPHETWVVSYLSHVAGFVRGNVLLGTAWAALVPRVNADLRQPTTVKDTHVHHTIWQLPRALTPSCVPCPFGKEPQPRRQYLNCHHLHEQRGICCVFAFVRPARRDVCAAAEVGIRQHTWEVLLVGPSDKAQSVRR